MRELVDTYLPFLSGIAPGALVRALVLVILGLVLAALLGRLLERVTAGQGVPGQRLLLRRVVRWGVTALFLAAALNEVGFQLGVLLGAAGVLTVAIGFAAQTSASNLVSGVFLMGENVFAIGDVVRVADVTGEVIAIDLLSVKLRTFDNLSVRLPNETLIKSQITNLTRFPIRRVDMPLSVAYREDLRAVRELLLDVADRNPLCLDEPAPLFIVTGYGASGIDLQLSAWGVRTNFLELRNALYTEIKEAFDAAGIEIPFPHVSLYAGSETAPIPVRWQGGAPGSAAG